MKKALALLLAVAATMSVSVTAFANDVNNTEGTTSVPETASSEATSSETTSSEVTSSAPESVENSSAQPSALVFGADANGVVLGQSLLEPGKEYKFPVSLKIDEQDVALSASHLDTYKFTYSKVSSNSVQTFKIDEYKGAYYLFVETKKVTPTKPIDVKYNVKLVKKADNLSVFGQEVKFSYGYDEANGDYVNGLDKGDVIEIDNSKPVITADQFDRIAEINDYKNVTLSGNSWKFTVNVTDETTKNMISSNAGIKDILAKFPDQDFKFYNFAGKPSFSATGRVALDVEDIVDDFAKLYTYRYADGKLYRLNSSFNSEDNTLEFRTNKLDTFVVTDKLIKDGTIVVEVENDNSNNSSDTEEDKGNPSTGASNMIDAAVMAAVASLAAGAVAVKKASK